MVRPDDSAIDHVSASISLDQFGQRLEHRLEHASLDPTSISAEDAVPLAILIRQMSPLRARARHPHHAFEITSVVLRRAAASTPLGWQQRPDQCPFLVRQTNPLAQGCLQMEALNQNRIPQSTFVHER